MKSNVKVEQIVGNKVIEDYGEILSRDELISITLKHFNNAMLDNNGNVYGEYNGKKYCIFLKNVSYLGIPHPKYKKRIQIPRKFLQLHEENCKKNVMTLLIGVYKYKNTVLFCNFDTTKYINNKVHNSSAHVFTIDLLNGAKNGIFIKRDNRGNEITVFKPNNAMLFIKNIFSKVRKSSGIEIFDTLDEFFNSMFKEWNGLDCYAEMIFNNFNNKFQPEWPGFYLEYKIDEFIKKYKKDNIIIYKQNKKKADIDLDLFFPKVNMYGDLKTHSSTSSAIQGNDWKTIMEVTEKGSIYYVVCNHDTIKDKDMGYIVTEFWNKSQGKLNLRSYGSKMKYSVKLNSYYILEINKYNRKYLSVFKQGKNSDGKPRNIKIMIENKKINNFLVHKVEF